MIVFDVGNKQYLNLMSIEGKSVASMMFVENPESSREIICVAPAEGEKPLNIMTDSNFEVMSNPDMFLFANSTFSNDLKS